MPLKERARVRLVDKRWYTPTEVAIACQVSRQAVWQWLESGALPGEQRGRWWHVLADDLEAFARARKAPL
jgi:hypothetical protein